MAKLNKKSKQIIDIGDLPRSGYVYSLYRGHILRLGIVVAGLVAILIWAWRGGWVSVKSNMFPSGTADYAAIAEVPMPAGDENDDSDDLLSEALKESLKKNNISRRDVWTQGDCYRLDVTLDSVEPTSISVEGAQVCIAHAGGYEFLSLIGEEPPALGVPCRAVFTKVPAELVRMLDESQQSLPGYLMELRRIQVGTEQSDSVEMLIFTPVVLALVVVWMLMLQNPGRHPIYRQLGRYGRVDGVVASIDREIAAGSILSESKKIVTTPTWVIKKSSFMSTIYKNTNPSAAGEKEIVPYE